MNRRNFFSRIAGALIAAAIACRLADAEVFALPQMVPKRGIVETVDDGYDQNLSGLSWILTLEDAIFPVIL